LASSTGGRGDGAGVAAISGFFTSGSGGLSGSEAESASAESSVEVDAPGSRLSFVLIAAICRVSSRRLALISASSRSREPEPLKAEVVSLEPTGNGLANWPPSAAGSASAL
jgi:hypothetical protein